MEDFAITSPLSSAQKDSLKAMLLKALEEVTGEAEDMIVEYIMVMIENGRTMSSMREELSTFISTEHATELIARLYQHLSIAAQPQQAQSKAAAVTTPNTTPKTTATTTADAKEEKPASAATAPKQRPQSKVISLRGSSSAASEALEKPLSSRREGPSSTAKAIQAPSKAAEQQREKEAKSQSTRLLANAMQASLKSTREPASSRKAPTDNRSKQAHQEQKNQIHGREERGAQRQAATGNKRNPQQQRDVEVEDTTRSNKRRKEVEQRQTRHGRDEQYEIELSDNEIQMAGHPGGFMPPPGMAGGNVAMGMMDPGMYFQQMEDYAQMMGFGSVDEYMEAYQQQMMSMMGGGMPPFGHAPRGRGFRGGRGARGRGRGRGPSRAPGPTTAPGRNMTWVREADMESALSSRR